MSGAKHRRKGDRVERELVADHLALGVLAERVPLSGAQGGSYTGDIIVGGFRCEVKARKDGAGFTTLEKWLGDNDVLFLKRNNADPMIVLPWATWAKLLSNIV